MFGTVEGTAGADIIDTGYTGDPEGEVVGAGADVVVALEGNDTVLGGAGDDSISGGQDDDVLFGDGGDDTLAGDDGQDILFGEDGNDVLDGGAGDDTVKGGTGNDVLTGGEGADWIAGGADRDTIIGGDACDLADGGADGDDVDVLDLRGLPPYILTNLVPDSNGNGQNGTVVFVDADGNPTGESFLFTEIEQIIEDDNDAPDAVDDTATTTEGSAVLIPVLDNDSDPEGDPLTVTSATATQGDVTILPDGTLEYIPFPGFSGTDTITYTVDDGNGGTDTAIVTVTVEPYNYNDAPDAVDDSAVTAPATLVVIPVLDNDTDPESDPLTVTGASATNGTVSVNVDGTLSYTPNPGFTGTDTITYTITDSQIGPGGLINEDTATVSVLVESGTGPDGTVEGTGGDDLIDVTYAGDPEGDFVDNNDAILPGDTGNDDLIYGFDGNDTIVSGDGDDVAYGGTGNDDVHGDGGNDTLFGGDGTDTLSGGDGNDVLRDRDGDNTYYGGAGDDRVAPGGLVGNDSILGGTGNDFLSGGYGDDVIDSSDGGIGAFDNPYPPLPADAFPDNDLDTVMGGAGNDIIRTGDDRDTIIGGSGNDTIDAGIDDDTVRGDTGNDTIIGGEGNDTIWGNAGDDTIYGGLSPVFPDSLNIPDDEGDLVPDNGLDTIFGGAGNDTIFGMDDDDTIYGGGGADVIDGGVDDDHIRGSHDNDLITGGQGNDDLYGDGGSDTISGGEDDDTLHGGHGNDTLTGGTGLDDIYGGNDRDVILGGNGGDTVDGGSGGDDFDVLNLTGSGVDFITYTSPDREDGIVTFLDGTTMNFTEIENVVPCFTPGTAIATPRGERLVEELQVGDRIITRDNGIQEIRWVGHKEVTGKALVGSPHLKPIMIKAGALGNGLPERDMLVSPNHRLLVASERTQLYFEESEVLAAAKHLVGAAGIYELDVMATTYIHFMFDQHEVVLSNGAWTESFQPGDYSLKGIGNAQRNEIIELFPELKTQAGLDNYQAARKTLKKHEAQLLVK